MYTFTTFCSLTKNLFKVIYLDISIITMYRIIINQKVYNTNPDTIYKTLSEVREYMNNTYFHGLDIVKKDTLYSMVSRLDALKSCAYKDFFSVEKVSVVD